MRKTLMFILATVMMAASLPADAGGYGYVRGGYHGHGHSHARVGVFIGAPLLFAPWYYPAPYYYSPPVVVRERVVVREPLVFYDEHGNPVPAQPRVAQAPAAPAPTQAPAPSSSTPSPSGTAPTWYFCADTQTYYPYAQTCASPWQRVMPQPPPQ